MSDAKKCDRCGQYYDRYATHAPNGDKGVTSMAFTSDHAIIQDYDLCPDCMMSLITFINAPKDNQTNSNDQEEYENLHRAVECCVNRSDCEGCPYDYVDYCGDHLKRDLLDAYEREYRRNHNEE